MDVVKEFRWRVRFNLSSTPALGMTQEEIDERENLSKAGFESLMASELVKCGLIQPHPYIEPPREQPDPKTLELLASASVEVVTL